jgi:hypothetical protein
VSIINACSGFVFAITEEQNGIKLYQAAARVLVFRLVVRVCEQKKNI